MGNEFLNKLAVFQKAEAEGKQRAGEFGQGLPVGMYIGKLQNLLAGRGKTSGRLQIHREILITEGEHANETSHDWMGLEHPVAISILTRFIEAHGFAMPAIIDEEASKNEGDFVYSQDLLDTLQAIQDGAPTYRIRIKQSGEFRNVDILSIEDMGSLGQQTATTSDPEEPVAETAEEAAEEQPAEEQPAEEAAAEDELLVRAIEFCQSVGLDVSEQEASLDDVKAAILGCAFPEEGVTAAQLKAAGFAEDDGVRYNSENVDFLVELGCEAAIIRKAVQKVPAKAAPKAAPAKVPAKAPAKAIQVKGKKK